MIIYRSVLLRIRNVSDKSCKENQNTRNNFFSRKSCLLWDNVEKYTVVPGRNRWQYGACAFIWRTKDTSTHSEYVVHSAIPPQQWLYESASVLRYTYTAPLPHPRFASCCYICSVFSYSLPYFPYGAQVPPNPCKITSVFISLSFCLCY